MYKKLQVTLGIAIAVFATSFATNLTISQPVYAACSNSFFGVPAWYRDLQNPSTCAVEVPQKGDKPDVARFILMIALNLIQAALVAVAYITLFYIIKGGFGYITSAGSSDGMASAKKTITNALIGLIIAVLSASIVNAIAGALG